MRSLETEGWRADRRYRVGRSPDWAKVKNRKSRVKDPLAITQLLAEGHYDPL
jgi:hypothetical protein